MRLLTPRLTSFLPSEHGTISIIFGAAIIAMVGFVGLSIDVGRSIDAHTKAAAALDSAALAATRAVFSGNKSVDEIETLAAEFFENNLKSAGDLGADYSDFTADVNTDTKTVKVKTTVHVPTTFGHIFGVSKVSFAVTARATFNVQDIELSLVLDVTGSMCQPCSKMAALKDASKELIDALMPENGGASEVKIALAPYSAAVNVGPLAGIASAGRSTDGCVVERDGSLAYDDAAPPADYSGVTDADIVSGSSFYFVANSPTPQVDIDRYQGRGGYGCPNAQLVPLSSDRDMLKSAIDGYTPRGGTAGHLGTAWGWYMIADSWGAVLSGESVPKPYGSANLIKAVVLMTDGDFNTSWRNDDSSTQAKALCSAMKNKNVIVYAVSFQSANHPTLKDCASTDASSGDLLYWDADNGSELTAAFKDIAIRLTNLRLDK
jgi:Flp pilus assembly protein TadG